MAEIKAYTEEELARFSAELEEKTPQEILRWAGHPDVRVLDGGFDAWTRAGHQVENGWPDATGNEPPRPAGDFAVKPGHLRIVGSHDRL